MLTSWRAKDKRMKKQCYQFREMLDSHIDHDTSVKSKRELSAHLEHCRVCREELARRRELRVRLRETWIGSRENQMRPDFADRLKAQLHSQALNTTNIEEASFEDHRRFSKIQRRWLITLVACLILTFTGGIVLFQVKRDTESALMPNLVKTELAKSAVGDHRDCAIQFRLAERSTDLEAAARKYDHAYIGLVKAVTSNGLLPDLEFVKAHSCIFQQRRFAHLIFKYHGRLVSLLVTDNENVVGQQNQALVNGQPNVIACSSFDGYRVSCFQTEQHAVFVVSDLPEGENLTLARAFESSVVEHLTLSEEPIS